MSSHQREYALSDTLKISSPQSEEDSLKEHPLPSLYPSALHRRKSRDFRKFWLGETISNLGSSFTQFALPLLIFTSFNLAEKRERKSIWHDVAEGLRYIFHHPILRAIPLLLVPVNFVSSIAASQLVLFSERQLQATDSQFALLNAAGSTGVIVAALVVARLLKRVSFTRLLLPTLALFGVAIGAMALSSSIWLAMLCWAVALGCEQFFNICTVSLRQTIVPNQLLGRVSTVNDVVAWSAIPLGSLTGGAGIKPTGNVFLVYLAVGVVIFLVAVVSAFTALGHADRYLPQQQEQLQPEVRMASAGN